MSRHQPPSLRCFLAIPLTDDFQLVREAVKRAVRKAGFEAVSIEEQPSTGHVIGGTLMAEIASSDCMIADISVPDPNIHMEIGMAHAMGKRVILITGSDAIHTIPFDLHGMSCFKYGSLEGRGAYDLRRSLLHVLREFRHSPQQAPLPSGARLSTPFFIDWDRLDRTDAENLCRELLSQMGLRRVDWYKESRELDLIAEYPRKDPDGFEYRELWLVSMGRNAPIEMLFDMALSEPEMFVHEFFRSHEQFERFLSREESTPITFLLIALSSGRSDERSEMIRHRISRHPRKSRYPFSVRMRLWDRDDLTALVQQFPNIGYKYFSDEARSLTKYRKGPEELYQENVNLSRNLLQANTALEEEKNRRVRAERDSVWKDISFSAAHKMGNPIFAIETDLKPLERRIVEKREQDALDVVSNIASAVEKAKSIVEQFKSLTKAQQINPIPILLRPLLEDCSSVLKLKDVACKIDCPNDLEVLGDPERLAEVFDELARNALHWMEGDDMQVSASVELADRSTLPSGIDSSIDYVVIHMRDNGSGVEVGDKDRIFNAFVTTHDQGTGLGLALIRRIIEGHGGAIREMGIPGQGADFEIYLPRPTEPKD